MLAKITDHTARPGPGYWNWRCMECSEACDDHVGALGYFWCWFLGLVGE